MMPDLSGQAVLITGAGRGLGRSTALHLAACGARIGIAERDRESCEDAAAEIRQAGGTAFAYPADVSLRDKFLEVAAAFRADCGPIDAVVNNANIIHYEPIEAVTEEVFDRMLAIGLKACVWGTQALLAHMDPRRGGCIVNLSSPVGLRGFPNTSAYASIKGAINSLTRTLAVELGPRRVRVNAVAPGSVPTPGARKFTTDEDYRLRAATVPLRRVGEDADNFNAIAFLLSREASFITGQVLYVDGGITVS